MGFLAIISSISTSSTGSTDEANPSWRLQR
jgi:hypothetical protein